MYIRPTVQSAPDVPRDPGCLGLAHERGDLDALRRSPQSIAVDHRVAKHDRADAGSSEHQPVDRDASGLIGVRLDWRRLVKDSIGGFAHGEISHDAAAAAMEQGFARSEEPRLNSSHLGISYA